jgi:ribosome modulation factor
MKDIYFFENQYHAKIRKPNPSWQPCQVEAWQAGYQFGLTGKKLPFNQQLIRYWNYGFETAMNERRRQEEMLCM